MVKERVNFEAAVDKCEELSAVLGVTFNQAEFDKVRELGLNVRGDIYMTTLQYSVAVLYSVFQS